MAKQPPKKPASKPAAKKLYRPEGGAAPPSFAPPPTPQKQVGGGGAVAPGTVFKSPGGAPTGRSAPRAGIPAPTSRPTGGAPAGGAPKPMSQPPVAARPGPTRAAPSLPPQRAPGNTGVVPPRTGGPAQPTRMRPNLSLPARNGFGRRDFKGTVK